MNPSIVILIVGFFYIVVFGGLTLLRREALSAQFAIEAGLFTLLVSGLSAWVGFSIHPGIFLLIVYLITMRARLLVDLANLFARRGDFHKADGFYQLARQLWPDNNSRLIVEINQGTASLQRGELDKAISIFKDILEQADQGYLSVKNEAAAHYNLGVAYLRKNMDTQATVEFNAVLD
ncbi:MAG: tetratricopeptide repeat protein, partial [Anaerolineales bacterium]